MINQSISFELEDDVMFSGKKFVQIFMLVLFFTASFLPTVALGNDGGVVLVLSGGGAKGLAHVGVIKALEERGIKISGIVGTSMGAIIGGLAASGYDGAELEKIFLELNMFALFSDAEDKNLHAQSSSKPVIKLSYDEKGRLIGRMGLMEGKKIYEEMLKYTSHVKCYDFMSLPVPFAAVATDLETGEAVVITKGNLASAMRASMSLPGIFAPWPYEDKLLIDGGLVANLPVRIAKELFPDCPVIAVDVTGKLMQKEQVRSMIDVLDQTVSMMTAKNVQEDLQYADVVIRPNVEDVSLMSFANTGEIMDRGFKAALEQMDTITALAPKATGVEKAHKSLIVKDVRLTGFPDMEKSFLEERRSWVGRPLDMAKVNDSVLELLSNGRVAMADYLLVEENEWVIIEFVVKRKAQREYSLSGYSTNISSNDRWISLEYGERDLFDLGDEAKLQVCLGENSSARVDYMGKEGSNWQFESSFAFQDWEISPENYGKVSWKRYFAYLGFDNVGEDNMSFGGGIAFDRTDDGLDESHWGPMVKFAYENKRDDKLESYFEASGLLWYPEGETLLGRMVFASSLPVEDKWRIVLSGGVEKGDSSNPAWAAYLGGYGEFLSRMGHPVMADNAAWVRVGVRSALVRGWWGRLEPEFFGVFGYAMDDSWSRTQELWEIGIGLNIPNRLIDLSVFALYDDRDDWTFGFSVGKPPVSYGPVRP